MTNSALRDARKAPRDPVRTKSINCSKRPRWVSSPFEREKKKASVTLERQRIRKNASKTLLEVIGTETVW